MPLMHFIYVCIIPDVGFQEDWKENHVAGSRDEREDLQ